jgi:L-aminopeptidase/D-esterase-like protein
VGAGAGALVGKLFGIARAMKGGVGSASLTLDGITVAALVVCNAMGDVFDPSNGQLLAGARTADGKSLLNARDALLAGQLTSEKPHTLMAGTNTTLGVVATDAVLTKAQAQRLAQVAHDGLARSINPVHTQLDGDTLFALGTGHSGKTANPVVNAVRAARGVTIGGQHWPASQSFN